MTTPSYVSPPGVCCGLHFLCRTAQICTEQKTAVVDAALALRDAVTDDEIERAWDDFDQAIDDYRPVSEA